MNTADTSGSRIPWREVVLFVALAYGSAWGAVVRLEPTHRAAVHGGGDAGGALREIAGRARNVRSAARGGPHATLRKQGWLARLARAGPRLAVLRRGGTRPDDPCQPDDRARRCARRRRLHVGRKGTALA